MSAHNIYTTVVFFLIATAVYVPLIPAIIWIKRVVFLVIGVKNGR